MNELYMYTKKFLKGLFGLLCIKTFVFLILLIGFSCTKQEYYPNDFQKAALNSFSIAFKNSMNDLKNRMDSQRLKYGNSKSLNIPGVFIDETQAQECLMPLYYESKSLLDSYGLLQEYINESGSADDSGIILAGLVVYAAELNEQPEMMIVASEVFLRSAYCRKPWVDCALDATGIAGAGELIENGIKASIKKLGVGGVAKILGKATGRTLGWIGIGWAAYDFFVCMDENY